MATDRARIARTRAKSRIRRQKRKLKKSPRTTSDNWLATEPLTVPEARVVSIEPLRKSLKPAHQTSGFDASAWRSKVQ